MSARRKLAVELLETRLLLAGNVEAVIENGGLFIRGDSAASGVSIHQVAQRRYIVTGFRYAAANTMVNGSFQPQRLYGVVNDINVNMQAGADIVVMHNNPDRRQELADELSGGTAGRIPDSPEPNLTTRLRVPRNLVLNTQGGDDGIGVDAVVGTQVFGGMVNINMREGNDQFIGHITALGESARMDMDDGRDTVRGAAVSLGKTVVLMGRGYDSLELADDRYGDLVVRMGEGNDTFSHVDAGWSARSANINMEAGSDLLRLFNVRVTNGLRINTGTGNDSVRISGSRAADFSLDLGVGNDQATIDDNAFTAITTIDAGIGDDTVTLDRLVQSQEFNVFMGDGADRFTLSNAVALRGRALGGLHFDTFDNEGGNDIDEFIRQEFERII